MNHDAVLLLESVIAAFLFAAAFLVGGRILAFRKLIRDPHTVTSFTAGMSSAYVFVHALPEISVARTVVAHRGYFPFEGALVYYVALLGFMIFYGLNEIAPGPADSPNGKNSERRVFRVRIAGFAVYVWLVSYLLVHGLERTATGKGLYAVALALHFLTIDNSLHEQHGAIYDRRGRIVLSAMAIGGWLSGVAFDLGHVPFLFAFIAGGVIVNSTIDELPEERHGRFVPFLLGGLLYGAVLLTVA